MPGRIPGNFIDDLVQRVDIVDLINSNLPLKKAGSNYVARCPFHNEKTPSFTVSREKQFFYCFGCGATGNAIGFLMDYGNLGFVEAVEDIASFVGIAVPSVVSNKTADQGYRLEALYDLQSKVALYYQNQLGSHKRKAINYLKRRELQGEIVKRYAIGYAPPEWEALSSRFDRGLLLEAGLLIKKDNGNTYDRFRDRIMFPIRDRRGRTIGFGGRVLDESSPKYLNSPETPTFHKGKEVYGLFELLDVCSKPERILIVEGYMDVIALAQHGITYSVATLGTATSREHIELLFRFCPELVFCFDGDSAGQKAAWRALEAALPCLRDGRQIRLMLLPSEHDPDSIVRSEGGQKFANRIATSKLLSDYFFQELCANSNLTGIEGRTALIETAKPLLAKIPNGVFQDMMRSRLAELTHVDPVELNEILANLYQNKKSFGDRGRVKPSAMRTAVALLLRHPEYVNYVESIERNWADCDLPGLNLLKQLAEIIRAHPNINTGGILERFRGLPEQKHIDQLIRWETLIPPQGVEREFKDAILRIGEQLNRELLEKLLVKANSNQLDESERTKMQNLLALTNTKK